MPDFNKMYELYDPCTVMFFFRYVLLKLTLQLNVVGLEVCCNQDIFTFDGIYVIKLSNIMSQKKVVEI